MTGLLSRRAGAALLAGVALLGLALLPVLHAESHAGAGARAKAQAARTAFALGFLAHRTAAQEAELRRAAALAFGQQAEEPRPDQAPLHFHDGAPAHSHGGLGHGAGALEHLGLALASAAPPSAVTPPAPLRAANSVLPTQPPDVARYLVPRFAQGPPGA